MEHHHKYDKPTWNRDWYYRKYADRVDKEQWRLKGTRDEAITSLYNQYTWDKYKNEFIFYPTEEQMKDKNIDYGIKQQQYKEATRPIELPKPEDKNITSKNIVQQLQQTFPKAQQNILPTEISIKGKSLNDVIKQVTARTTEAQKQEAREYESQQIVNKLQQTFPTKLPSDTIMPPPIPIQGKTLNTVIKEVTNINPQIKLDNNEEFRKFQESLTPVTTSIVNAIPGVRASKWLRNILKEGEAQTNFLFDTVKGTQYDTQLPEWYDKYLRFSNNTDQWITTLIASLAFSPLQMLDISNLIGQVFQSFEYNKIRNNLIKTLQEQYKKQLDMQYNQMTAHHGAVQKWKRKNIPVPGQSQEFTDLQKRIRLREAGFPLELSSEDAGKIIDTQLNALRYQQKDEAEKKKVKLI